MGGVLDCVKSVTQAPDWDTPVVGMVSYSLVHRIGPAAFLDRAQGSGLSGVIVPDLPAEEADEFAALTRERDFKLILLVTPTTSPERAELVVKACSGFVYCVSLVGITGERDQLPTGLTDQLARLRTMTDLPLCVGFGVSRPEHAAALRDVADGVIVGSAIVRRVEKLAAGATGRQEVLGEVSTLVAEFAQALRT